MAQSAERVLGKDEVTSSNLVSSSKENRLFTKCFVNGRFSFVAVKRALPFLCSSLLLFESSVISVGPSYPVG